MKLAVKIPLLLCAVFCAVQCSAPDTRYLDCCFVHYLKEKGKLEEKFQSFDPPMPQCRVIARLGVARQKSNFKRQVRNGFPNEAVCLNNGFENKEVVDYFLKFELIKRSSFLSASAKGTQMEEARGQFKNALKEIALQCLVVDDNFIKIFNNQLKNETSEAHEHEYCMAKYVVDNQLLELNNVDLNQHQIDTESVDCDIIDVEQSKTERELIGKLSATEAGQRSSDCVMNAYRNGNMFGWKVALKALNYLDITNQVKEVQTNRVSKKVDEFRNKLISECEAPLAVVEISSMQLY